MVIRKIPRFAAEHNGLSHHDNFRGWVSRVRQVASLARPGSISPEMSVKIRVDGAEIHIEASSLQEMPHGQEQD
jgi:sensor domain CHASE-containing protein